jgi:hypothetical protein
LLALKLNVPEMVAAFPVAESVPETGALQLAAVPVIESVPATTGVHLLD